MFASRFPHQLRGPAAALLISLLVTGCASGPPTPQGSGSASAQSPGPSAGTTAASTGLVASSRIHEVSLSFDQAAYDAMIETFVSSGDKEWIEGTVTIDGTTFERVGLRLKGNSSLMGLRGNGRGGAGGPGGNVSADTPESLPWLVRCRVARAACISFS